MFNCTVEKAQRVTAKVAGFAYLFTVIGSILYWIFIGSKLTITGNSEATLNAVLSNESLFRIGLIFEMGLTFAAAFLAFTHYIMLKPVHKNIAFLGFTFRLIETMLLAVMLVLSFVTLQILNNIPNSTQPELIGSFIGLFLNVRIAGNTISAIFMTFGMILFLFLLYLSKYIPRIISGFGIFSYLLLLSAAFINIITPKSAISMMTMNNTFDTICVLPSCVFELIIGFWLLVKGLNLPMGEQKACEVE